MTTDRPQAKAAGCLRWLLVTVGSLLAAYVIGLIFLPPVQTATRAALLLPELVELPVRPLLAITDEPRRITTSYGAPPDRLDIYIPAGNHRHGSLPGVVLVLGIAPQPIDHPEITRVAEGISRLGVVVGVQDSTVLRQNRIVPEEPAHLADAFLVLAQRPEVDRKRIGLVGFSAGASVALIAAADPRIDDDLRYVSNFGGYADAATLLIDVSTRTMVLDGEEQSWHSEPIIRQRLLDLMLERIDDGPDRDLLRRELQPVIESPAAPGGADPAVEEQLSGDALAAYRLFTAPNRESARAALDGGSAELRGELALISPMTFIDDIGAYVFTMHGVGDDAVPIAHAHQINAALDPRLVGHFAQFGRFGHAQPGRGGLSLDDIPDLFELGVFLHHIVAAATE